MGWWCRSERLSDLDFFLVESVDEQPNVGRDAILAVVHKGQRTFGIHRLAGEELPLLERTKDLLHGTLGVSLEDGGALGVVGLEVLQRFLLSKIRTNSIFLGLHTFMKSLTKTVKAFLSKKVSLRRWAKTMLQPVTVSSSVSSMPPSAEALPPNRASSSLPGT